MDLGLTGKAALVVAASTGLGEALATQLAQEGCRVAICARRAGRLEAAADRIARASGQRPGTMVGDVTDPEVGATLVRGATDLFGTLDILVTNAGGPQPGGFLDLAPDDWQDAIELTLMSVVRLIHAAVPAMAQQKGGSILAITSVTVKQPLPKMVLSNSIRLAVTGLVKSLADELAEYNIRVNAICPGWTRTARVEQLVRDRAKRHGTSPESESASIVGSIPLRRMATPSEFARAAAFLVSPAASYITGHNLVVDGGLYRGTL